ncbi:putative uncharacterized protein encoded by CRHR1-IT1 [Hylobates moloch]|uniref:putative uncharacterized protein encoded by CRHR1-IT1 n=1 Tax=Hylobates moloch TaxID=81572 RepID=UPI001363318F|nr:putative uncharacterized protein encoded by CRHR1-IT1 [Hylobates moloch]
MHRWLGSALGVPKCRGIHLCACDNDWTPGETLSQNKAEITKNKVTCWRPHAHEPNTGLGCQGPHTSEYTLLPWDLLIPSPCPHAMAEEEGRKQRCPARHLGWVEVPRAQEGQAACGRAASGDTQEGMRRGCEERATAQRPAVRSAETTVHGTWIYP